jgi:hypothetical protein
MIAASGTIALRPLFDNDLGVGHVGLELFARVVDTGPRSWFVVFFTPLRLRDAPEDP